MSVGISKAIKKVEIYDYKDSFETGKGSRICTYFGYQNKFMEIEFNFIVEVNSWIKNSKSHSTEFKSLIPTGCTSNKIIIL